MTNLSSLSLLGRSAYPIDIKLDAFIQANRKAVIDLLTSTQKVEDYRFRVKSRYVDLMLLYKEKTGEDLSALVREKLADTLDSTLADLIPVRTNNYVSIEERLKQFYLDIPGADINSSIQIIRYARSEKVSLRTIRDDQWFTKDALTKICQCTGLNYEWLYGDTEYAPCSLFIRSTGMSSDILKSGDNIFEGQIISSKLYIFKAFEEQKVILLQVADVANEVANPVVIKVLGKVDYEDIPSIAARSAAKHVPVLIAEPKYQHYDLYRTGNEPLSILFKGASVFPYSDNTAKQVFSS
ncbi:hypothetical protein V6259_13030 [Marinomonas sp. TI.3.20]|uniref:hypothetical protein n=1 Tax=Marinomonas sp. TI.3.20 TaxID=3121296 RepID=UPI00311D7998